MTKCGARSWHVSGRMLFALVAVVSFLILGLVGMHLHGVDSATHLNQGAQTLASASAGSEASATTSAALSATTSATLSADPAAHPTAAEPDRARQGSLSLELVTACMLGLLLTMVLVARRLQRRQGTRLPRRASDRWRLDSWLPRGRRPLYLLFSISRT